MSSENPYPSHDPVEPAPRGEMAEPAPRVEDAADTRPDVEHTARLDDASGTTPPAEPSPPAGEPSPLAWEAAIHDEEPARNTFSVGYFVTGLVFLGIAGIWLAQELGAVEVADFDLLVPLLLVVVGAAGLVAGLARAARRG
jgi:hypothetical protein